MREQNPDYRPVQHGEMLGSGIWGKLSYVEKWDAVSHGIRREWSDGRVDINAIGFNAPTPTMPRTFIFHKRESPTE